MCGWTLPKMARQGPCQKNFSHDPILGSISGVEITYAQVK